MNPRIYLLIARESVSFAIQNLKANLLRTLLSLSGITIGVFCIISILSLVDSLEINVKQSVSKFGSDVVFIQKWPWEFGSEYPWWKYINRPEVSYRDMQQLKKRYQGAEAVTFNVWVRDKKICYNKTTMEDVTIRGVGEGYSQVIAVDILAGRFITDAELYSGSNVIALGNDLAASLFNSPDQAIGKTVTVFDRKLVVCGVLTKQGNGVGMNADQDKQGIVPYTFLRGVGDFDGIQNRPTIMVKAPEKLSVDKLGDELHGMMRSIRRLPPKAEENFAINKITMVTTFLAGIFDKISLYGWIIAGFSILVGGFGIANIMFVSVKERTHLIGIQKSIGARKVFIMIQFLGESILLCIIGGLIGILLIFLLSTILNFVLPFKIYLTLQNIFIGLGLSSIIGVLSGYFPARAAANLDPIEAIRSHG